MLFSIVFVGVTGSVHVYASYHLSDCMCISFMKVLKQNFISLLDSYYPFPLLSTPQVLPYSKTIRSVPNIAGCPSVFQLHTYRQYPCECAVGGVYLPLPEIMTGISAVAKYAVYFSKMRENV